MALPPQIFQLGSSGNQTLNSSEVNLYPSDVNCFVSSAPLDANSSICKDPRYHIRPMFLVIHLSVNSSLVHRYYINNGIIISDSSGDLERSINVNLARFTMVYNPPISNFH